VAETQLKKLHSVTAPSASVVLARTVPDGTPSANRLDLTYLMPHFAAYLHASADGTLRRLPVTVPTIQELA
jgi:hypothetical protein